VWLPAVIDERLYAAFPEPSSATDPSEVDPSKKITLPVGVPEAAVTVAVNVADPLAITLVADELRAVLVAAGKLGGVVP